MILQNSSVFKIQKALLRVLNNSYNHADIRIICNLFISIAATYIRSRIKSDKLYFPINTNSEKDLYDFALDTVASLFKRNEDGQFIILMRYFKPLMKEIGEDQDFALIHSRRLVISRVKQEIIEYFKVMDPSGWKIYRNIQLAPGRNPEIGTLKHLDTVFYYLKGINGSGLRLEELSPHLPEIPEVVLKEWILSAIKKAKTTPELINTILKRLRTEDYRDFISRSRLFKCIRIVLGLNEIILEDEIYQNSLLSYDSFEGEDTRQLFKGLFSHLKSIISKTYLQKQKLALEDSHHYIQILKDYFTDMLNGVMNRKLPEYMSEHWLKDDFITHRSRLEYLIKIGRKYLQTELENFDSVKSGDHFCRKQ